MLTKVWMIGLDLKRETMKSQIVKPCLVVCNKILIESKMKVKVVLFILA